MLAIPPIPGETNGATLKKGHEIEDGKVNHVKNYGAIYQFSDRNSREYAEIE